MSHSEARAVPFYCPFCGEEDLYPHEEGHGTWHCVACTRVFGLRLVGLHARPVPASSKAPDRAAQ